MVNLVPQEWHKGQFKESLDRCEMYSSISEVTQAWFGSGRASLGMIVNSLFSTV